MAAFETGTTDRNLPRRVGEDHASFGWAYFSAKKAELAAIIRLMIRPICEFPGARLAAEFVGAFAGQKTEKHANLRIALFER